MAREAVTKATREDACKAVIEFVNSIAKNFSQTLPQEFIDSSDSVHWIAQFTNTNQVSNFLQDVKTIISLLWSNDIRLLCSNQSVVEWAVARDLLSEPNPFKPWLAVFQLGMYPLSLANGDFLLVIPYQDPSR